MPRQWGTTELIPDPAAAQNPASKNYVDTTTATLVYGGWGAGDFDLYADLLSTYPRTLLQFIPTANHMSIGSVAGNTQQAILFRIKRAASSTGVRYVTGQAAQSGQTTTVSLYSGTTPASMTLLATVTAPFSALNTLVQVAWGSAQALPVGYAAIMFTSNTNVAAPAQLLTPGQVNPAGTGFTAPTASQFTIAQRAGTALTTPMDFTTGWTTEALLPWISIY